MNEKIALSVMVTTRNRALSLARLLNGLAEQVQTPLFEVVVGDNGSTDDTAEIVEGFTNRMLIRYVRVERPGKGRALNAALALARGALIVLTDDDVLPRQDWLSSMYRASLEHPECNIFGGRIEVNIEAVPNWVRRSFNLMGLLTSAHDKAENEVRYGYGEYPFGPNMAIRRHLIANIEAPYPEHMGPGTGLPIGDESHFFMQFSPPEASDRLFVPSACVLHEVEVDNVAFKFAVKRCFLAGRVGARLGLPAVTQQNLGSNSTLMVALDRIRTCRTLREFACIGARYLGYISARCPSYKGSAAWNCR
jgi:cellulose synthase/poly-beta-1,6-N-acetylglucosamine synthase-like glycosyltransferase